MVDCLCKAAFEPDQLNITEVAQEDTELHMVTVAHKGLEDAVPPLVVRYIIRDEIAFPHRFITE